MRTRGWSKSQDELLKILCSGKVHVTSKEMSAAIGKSTRSIYDRISFLGIERTTYYWSDDEKKELERLYKTSDVSVEKIAEKLGKTERAITSMVSLLKLKRSESNYKLDKFMLDHYKDKNITAQIIADKFNRPIKTIYRRASELGLTEQREFDPVTTKQVRMIVDKYQKTNLYILSAEVGLPDYTIRRIAKSNNIKKKKEKKINTKVRRRLAWTSEQENFIRNNCRNMTMAQMAGELKINYNSVRGKVNHLGLNNINLKIYSVGNIRFKYNTQEEKERKIEYVTMIVTLINNTRIGDVYR